MSVRRTAITALLVVLSLAGARAQAPTVTAAQRAEIEKTVAEQVRAYYRAIESMDTAASAAFWSPTRTRGQWQGQVVTSPAGMLELQKTAFAVRQAHRFELAEVSVLPLSADLAVASFRGSFRNELKNGNVANFFYSGTQLWGREAGGWKLIMGGESTLAK